MSNERRIGHAKSFPSPDGELAGYRKMTLANAAVLTEAIARRRTRGAAQTMDRLATEMGVSRRTLYRWRDCTFHDVTVGGWTALFVTRPHHDYDGPVQVTPWMPTDEADAA